MQFLTHKNCVEKNTCQRHSIFSAKNTNKQKGFAILYTMLIIAMSLGLSVSIANIVYRERALSRIGRDSLNARAAADVGIECMLFNDKMPTRFDPTKTPTFPIFCGRDNNGSPVQYMANMTSSRPNAYTYTVNVVSIPNGPCFKSYLERDISVIPPSTKIDIFGYNICDTNNASRVERGITAEY